ncbi:hypothetical protein [Actinomadura rugatobispora]|uniref:Uncharacterized protein n=1 Tax=Actinomadura rugatobispora TaxID=1994 RepID=A0ABW0ZQU2_9ACTN|nr:hypothetical protein GCM10010200_035790 [Actinomadura rugatobispora]
MKTKTRPLTLADAFEAMANVELQEQDRDEKLVTVPAIQSVLEPLTIHLLPDGRDLWWGEFKRCLVARQRAENGDAPWHDGAGVDWDARVAEALERLTGGDRS